MVSTSIVAPSELGSSQGRKRGVIHSQSASVPPFWNEYNFLQGLSSHDAPGTSQPSQNQQQAYQWASTSYPGPSGSLTSQMAGLVEAGSPYWTTTTGELKSEPCPLTFADHPRSIPTPQFGSNLGTSSKGIDGVSVDFSPLSRWLFEDGSSSSSLYNHPASEPRSTSRADHVGVVAHQHHSSLPPPVSAAAATPSHADFPAWMIAHLDTSSSNGCDSGLFVPPFRPLPSFPLDQAQSQAQQQQPQPQSQKNNPLGYRSHHASARTTSASSPAPPSTNLCASAKHSFRITSDIFLPSRSGQPNQHIYYPRGQVACDGKMPSSLPSTQSPLRPDQSGLLPCSSPPQQDFLHSHADKRPKQQPEKRRSDEDLYTPIWVRGEGIAREGWCSLCEPGRWLQLKTSQYWYHVQNIHGINPATGLIYDPPRKLRIYDDNTTTVEGWCQECQRWQPICTARRKRTFAAWFSHAKKCHAASGSSCPSSRFRLAEVGRLSSSSTDSPSTTLGPLGLVSSPQRSAGYDSPASESAKRVRYS